MKVDGLTLTFMKPKEAAIIELKHDLLAGLKPFLHKLKLTYEVYPQFAVVQCLNTVSQNWKHSEKIEIGEVIAQSLADYIISQRELIFLRQVICEEFSYDNEAEINKIMHYCHQMLNVEDDILYVSDHGRQRRQATISGEIKQFFKKNIDLNVDGLLEFRLKAYKDELHEIVEYAVDEFLMDKQYQEFIALLKYFVYIQEAKIPAVHLMHKGGHEFALYNEQMKPLDVSAAEDTFKIEVLDQEFNFEDLVVSTLISVAPQQIYIHTREPEVQVIQTISQIFENRVKLCDFCRQCKPILGERMIQNKHYT
jgi:putative sporulation protein YtxC